MSIEATEVVYNSIVKSIELALSGAINVVATAPINKVKMRMRYQDFIGHTELFQRSDPYVESSSLIGSSASAIREPCFTALDSRIA